MADVSVVVPAYNSAAFLADALESVRRQSLSDVECIVVDDGSTDDTRAIAEGHPACSTCISQPNRGVAAARNTGVSHASGMVLAFLDSDDAWLPQRLELMMGRLESERADAVLCSTLLCDESLNQLGRLEMDGDTSAERMLLQQVDLVSPSSSLLITRDAFSSIGGFNESFATSADWYLLFNVVDRLRWANEPEPLVLYRQHPGGMSRNLDRMAVEMLGIYEDLFAGDGGGRHVSRRRAFGALHRVIAGSYFATRRYGSFARHAGRSLWLSPVEARYFASALLRLGSRNVVRTKSSR